MKQICIFALLIFTTAVTNAQSSSELPDLELKKCVLDMPGTSATAEAECGWLTVLENRQQPDSKKIRLRFVLARAIKPTTDSTPIFFFAGGPGQAASELWVQLVDPLKKLQRKHDIVLLDQRGTGTDSPLSCTLDDESMDLRVDLGKVTQQARECLQKIDGDPRFYTTTLAMADYEQLRIALGYNKINLMGTSYGTRAVQEYLRRYPDVVRTITLDSVAPVELILGSEHAMNLDLAMTGIFGDCRNDPDCNAAFPDVEKQLQQLIQQARNNPQMLTIDDPLSGDPVELEANMDVIGIALRMLSYSSSTQAQLPFLINDAVINNNPKRLLAQALMVMYSMQGMISHWMELSVICSEDYPFMQARPQDANTIIGEVFYKMLIAQCEIWPRGEVPADFHQPFSSDVPALLLSGEFDPVTPPRYADQAAKQFSQHLNLVVKGQGHSVSFSQCTREIVTDFITTASFEELDTSCLENQGRAPFFVNLLGPTP
ncbi:MAG: alpha/beta hydrolase [Xanthomonadales bacterium]|nr:alpha/beta hydrolase [Xanthomonadales bacterium]